MLPHDPNGGSWPQDFYEPKCRQCGRFDANCSCDNEWPQPASAPTTPPDDEGREVPGDA